jgi:peptide/nickel transport system substrate-binding protein
MKKSRKLIALAVSLIMCLSLVAACAPATPAPGGTPATPPPGVPESIDVIGPGGAVIGGGGHVEEGAVFADYIEVIGEASAFSVLNPFLPASNSPACIQVFIMIYDRLIDNLGEGVFGPSLAVSWYTDDYQTIVMNLRDNVYFHNGERFTADDVVATVMAAREGIGSMAHDLWRSVYTVSVISPLAVEFVLTSVNVDFFFDISLAHASILNGRAIAEGTESGMWIGTGAFYVESFSSNNYATLIRNNNYWGEPPITRMITFRDIPELSARTIMLQNGESHIALNVAVEDVALFADDPQFTVHTYFANNPSYISFNMNDPIAGDINFRRAVAHAINRADLAMAGAGAFAAPATDGNFYGFYTEFRHLNIPILPFDLDKARAYLEASSWSGEVIEISSAIVTHIRTAEMLQTQLAQIGLQTSVNSMDVAGFTAFATYRDNRSVMATYVMPTTLSASSIRNAFLPGSALNRASYNNPEVTELLLRGPTVTDLEERIALYHRIQELVAEDIPYIHTFNRLHTVVAVSGLGGIVLSPVMHHDLRYAYMIIG